MTTNPNGQDEIVILGAGVIGLTCALVLHQRGIRVSGLIAREGPEDLDNGGFSSPWAACNWYPFDLSSSTPASKREVITFKYLEELSKSHPDLCERIPFYSVWDNQKPVEDDEFWFRDIVGDYETLGEGSIPSNKKYGRRWTAFILHAPNYLGYLSQKMKEAGIPIMKKRLSSIDEALDIHLSPPGDIDTAATAAAAASSSHSHLLSPSGSSGSTCNTTDKMKRRIIINATGLGSKVLLGVEDDLVYPARGQTVLVRAPNAKKECIMHAEGFTPKAGGKQPEPAYIIPRPGPEPHFILGGTYIPNDYSTLPKPDTADRILQDCFQLKSDLSSDPQRGWEGIEVVSHNVGIRPAREGGARIEVEKRKRGDRPGRQRRGERGLALNGEVEGRADNAGKEREEGKNEMIVVHAYGFGSAGYQQSWGAGLQVADLIQECLSQK